MFGIPFVIRNNIQESGIQNASISIPAVNSPDSYVSPKIISADTPLVIYSRHYPTERYDFGGDVRNLGQQLSDDLQKL